MFMAFLMSTAHMSGVMPELAAGAFTSAYPFPTRNRTVLMEPANTCVDLRACGFPNQPSS